MDISNNPDATSIANNKLTNSSSSFCEAFNSFQDYVSNAGTTKQCQELEKSNYQFCDTLEQTKICQPSVVSFAIGDCEQEPEKSTGAAASSTLCFSDFNLDETISYESHVFQRPALKRPRVIATFDGPVLSSKKVKLYNATAQNLRNAATSASSFSLLPKVSSRPSNSVAVIQEDGAPLYHEYITSSATNTWQLASLKDIPLDSFKDFSTNVWSIDNKATSKWNHNTKSDLNQTLSMPNTKANSSNVVLVPYSTAVKFQNRQYHNISENKELSHISSGSVPIESADFESASTSDALARNAFANISQSLTLPVMQHVRNSSDGCLPQSHTRLCSSSGFMTESDSWKKFLLGQYQVNSQNEQGTIQSLALQPGYIKSYCSRSHASSFLSKQNQLNKCCETTNALTYDFVVKGLPKDISPNDLFCLVPGRLGPSKKHEVLVGEILRRVLVPESLNISHLSPILRKAKSKHASQYLRERLQQIGIELPQGRRKTAPCTLFTSLTESESCQLASDFAKLCEEKFPSGGLADYALRHFNSLNCNLTTSSIESAREMVKVFMELLNPNLFGLNPKETSTSHTDAIKRQLNNFQTLTHGFGLTAILNSLAMFRAFLSYLVENC